MYRIGDLICDDGRPSLILDAEVGRAGMHEIFGVPERPGLADLLMVRSRTTEHKSQFAGCGCDPSNIDSQFVDLPAGTPQDNPQTHWPVMSPLASHLRTVRGDFDVISSTHPRGARARHGNPTQLVDDSDVCSELSANRPGPAAAEPFRSRTSRGQRCRGSAQSGRADRGVQEHPYTFRQKDGPQDVTACGPSLSESAEDRNFHARKQANPRRQRALSSPARSSKVGPRQSKHKHFRRIVTCVGGDGLVLFCVHSIPGADWNGHCVGDDTLRTLDLEVLKQGRPDFAE